MSNIKDYREEKETAPFVLVQQNEQGISLSLWGLRRESSCFNIAHLDLWCGNMFLEANTLVNNITADNAWLWTASLVTSTPRVPFNYPRLPHSFWKGVRLYDSLSISSFHKFSRCAPFLVMNFTEIFEGHIKNG
jgi:hypothetical protein